MPTKLFSVVSNSGRGGGQALLSFCCLMLPLILRSGYLCPHSYFLCYLIVEEGGGACYHFHYCYFFIFSEFISVLVFFYDSYTVFCICNVESRTGIRGMHCLMLVCVVCIGMHYSILVCVSMHQTLYHHCLINTFFQLKNPAGMQSMQVWPVFFFCTWKSGNLPWKFFHIVCVKVNSLREIFFWTCAWNPILCVKISSKNPCVKN